MKKQYSREHIRKNAPWETQKYHQEKDSSPVGMTYEEEQQALDSILGKPKIAGKGSGLKGTFSGMTITHMHDGKEYTTPSYYD